MLPATKRREVFLIWGCTDSPPNLKADEKVRVDLDADGIETIEALADRAKKEFGMTTVPDLLAPRSFELLESTADLKHQTEVAVVPADQEGERVLPRLPSIPQSWAFPPQFGSDIFLANSGVKIPIKPKLMCDVINTAKNGATAIVALQELIGNLGASIFWCKLVCGVVVEGAFQAACGVNWFLWAGVLLWADWFSKLAAARRELHRGDSAGRAWASRGDQDRRGTRPRQEDLHAHDPRQRRRHQPCRHGPCGDVWLL